MPGMNRDADALEQGRQPLSLVCPLCSVDRVVGRARRPRLSDRPQLPYLESFILETAVARPLPIAVPSSMMSVWTSFIRLTRVALSVVSGHWV